MKRNVCCLAAGALLAALVAFLTTQVRSAGQDKTPQPEKAPPAKEADDAIKWQKQALEDKAYYAQEAVKASKRLKWYQDKKPWREE